MKSLDLIVGILMTVILLSACSAVSSQSHEHEASHNKTMNETPMKNKPNHHTETGFQNDPFVETAAAKGPRFYLRRAWDSLFVPDVPDGHVLSETESAQLLKSVTGERITWLGHASFLIRISGMNVLTDPFLTDYASPVPFAGPRRFVGDAIPINELPAIDVVIVSHNHYDHLDDKTVRSLPNKDNINVVVPLGLKSFFTERGYSKVTELDWGDSKAIDKLKFTALSAVHDSARSVNDKDKTLWSSWAIEGQKKKVFFVGDSGYSDTIYKKIGEQFGSFDYAILPIGAYEPRELLWMSHVTPEEAVAVGLDIKAKTLIASHWGTLSSLSDEPPFEPPVRFKASGIEGGFSENDIWVMKIGETRPMSTSVKPTL